MIKQKFLSNRLFYLAVRFLKKVKLNFREYKHFITLKKHKICFKQDKITVKCYDTDC